MLVLLLYDIQLIYQSDQDASKYYLKIYFTILNTITTIICLLVVFEAV